VTLALTQPSIADSPLSRWDPRWKLAALAPAAVLAALLRTLPAALVVLLVALLLTWVARLPLRWYLVRIGVVVLFLMLFVAWLPFLPSTGPAWNVGPIRLSQDGLLHAALVLSKTVAVVTLMLLLWATAPLEVTFKAAHALHIPGLLVQLVFLSYRYLFLLADEFDRLRIALRVRGFRNRSDLHSYRTIGHVSGILLVRSYERAERVAAAMRCRGFDGQFHCLTDFRTRGADVALYAMLLGPLLAILAWDIVKAG